MDKKKKLTKQDKAIMEIIKILRDNDLTLDVEHQVVIKKIKRDNKEEK